jgi:hypothetical protein
VERRFGLCQNGIQQQMLEHVLPPNVHDEGPARANSSDVVEILLRSHTDEHPSHGPQPIHDLDVRGFVRNDVVGIEESARLG